VLKALQKRKQGGKAVFWTNFLPVLAEDDSKLACGRKGHCIGAFVYCGYQTVIFIMPVCVKGQWVMLAAISGGDGLGVMLVWAG
jgi:hypothetical protein